MSKQLRIRLTSSTDEMEVAFSLLYRSYRDLGLIGSNPSKMWLTKWHMLPTTTTIIAMHGKEIVGATSLFIDGNFGIPIDQVVRLAELRQEAAKVGECSLYAVPNQLSPQESTSIKQALHQFVLGYCTRVLGLNHLITQHKDQDICEDKNYFKSLVSSGYKICYLDLGNIDIEILGTNLNCDFQYPERKFFHLFDTQWTVENFRNFFIKRTNLFESLNEFDLKTLQNLYDFGPFQVIFDEKRSSFNANFRAPKHKRFAMNCNGEILREGKGPIGLQIVDVSAGGLRAFCEKTLTIGASYVIRISIGANTQTEVIAKLSWRNATTQNLGFEIASTDKSWEDLIKHLEDISRSYEAA